MSHDDRRVRYRFKMVVLGSFTSDAASRHTRRRVAVFVLGGMVVAIGAVSVAAAARRPTPAESPVVAAVGAPAADATEIDLGEGFSATVDGMAVTISHSCDEGLDVYTRTEFAVAPDGLEPYKFVGSGSENPIELENDFGRIYSFACGDDVSSQRTGDSECVAFSESDKAITPTLGVCPSYFPVIETMYLGTIAGPGMLFPARLGANKPYEAVSVRLRNISSAACEYGDTMVLWLDDKELGAWSAALSQSVTLPQLSGTHRLTTTCRYGNGGGPEPAQRGACMSIAVADDGSFTSKDCTGPDSTPPNVFGLVSADPSDSDPKGLYKVVGGCGGYGFEAYTTTADGMITASAASAKANGGDIANLNTTLQADPNGFFVGVCWTDLAGTVPGPLVCYHVEGDADGLGWDYASLKDGESNCPFANLRTVSTR